MNRLKKAFALIRSGDFKTLFRMTVTFLRDRPYRIRARIEDWRIGRISIDKQIPTRFAEAGSRATESTDYRWLDKIFQSLPLQKDAVFVDVGCGEGRVLTYLYLRGFRGPMMGIELDPDVAGVARKRTEKCPNIEVYCGNILESRDIIAKATVFYLFNPFSEAVLVQFIRLIEECCDHPVRMYYCNDLYMRQLDKRENWTILRRNVLKGPNAGYCYYTIYRFTPKQ